MEFLHNLYVRYADPAFQAGKVGCWVWIFTTQTDVSYPVGSMYAIYGNMDPINIPQMLAYIPAPWIQIISLKKMAPAISGDLRDLLLFWGKSGSLEKTTILWARAGPRNPMVSTTDGLVRQRK